MKGLNRDSSDTLIEPKDYFFAENIPQVQQVPKDESDNILPNSSKFEELQLRYQKEFEDLMANDEYTRLFMEKQQKEYEEKEKDNNIKNFIKQLRESDELMIKIFNNGSCYKLTKILKSIYPEAKALYSQKDGHWITEIEERYYDIGGEVNEKYVIEKEYEYSPQFEASADIPTYSSNVGVPYDKYK